MWCLVTDKAFHKVFSSHSVIRLKGKDQLKIPKGKDWRAVSAVCYFNRSSLSSSLSFSMDMLPINFINSFISSPNSMSPIGMESQNNMNSLNKGQIFSSLNFLGMSQDTHNI